MIPYDGQSHEEITADLRPIKMLPPEEQAVLVRRAQAGDRDARDTLVLTNWRLVMTVARDFAQRYPIPLADLLQCGMIGLIYAVEKFKPAGTNRFTTYAIWWIRKEILRQIPHEVHSFGLPERVFFAHQRHTRLTRQLEDAGEPTTVEGLYRLGMTPAQIADAHCYVPSPISLDVPPPNWRSEDVGENIVAAPETDPAITTERHYLSDTLREALTNLTARERAVLRIRLGLDGGDATTLTIVSQKLNISSSRAQQIEAAALAKLRAAYLKGPSHEPTTSDPSRHRPRREHPVGAGSAQSH